MHQLLDLTRMGPPPPGLPDSASYGRPLRRNRTRLPVPVSILSVIGIVLYLQFAVLPGFLADQHPSALRLSQLQLDRLEAALQKCIEFNTPLIQYTFPASPSRANPRWNPTN